MMMQKTINIMDKCNGAAANDAYLSRGGAGCSSLHNLHAMVAGVSHDDAPVAVDGNTAIRGEEMSVAKAVAADGANMGAVAVAQHLHVIIACYYNNNVTCGIERDTRGISELAGA